MGAMMPTPILVEQRFPLDLDESDRVIRELYERAKADRWDPFRDFDWTAIRTLAASTELRTALRLAYSRRAWHEYTGLSDTPAVLIRFCLEPGREADPKYFLTVRNTEEAWHIECFHSIARVAGGEVAAPGDRTFEGVFNACRHRLALDATASLDAYVVTYCAIEDELELGLARASLARSVNEPIRSMWERIVTDRARHAQFGWAYAARRASQWDSAVRAQILDSIRHYIEDRVFAGYQCVSFAPVGVADDLIAAETILDDAGLGGVGAAAEARVLADCLDLARTRLGPLGISLPFFKHAARGTF
jgi:hypothetical protein